MSILIPIPDVTAWEEKFWYSTGGTRAKKYLEKPDGSRYYFKRSMEKQATDTKPGKYFRFEFWSEIIACQVGSTLGFNVLEYIPAIDGDRVGCLCEDMIDSNKEELIGGIQYVQGAMPSFDPEKNENRIHYTFQLIEKALNKYGLERMMPEIVEMIVFDALIGNSDRHQENWAVISDFWIPIAKRVNKLIQLRNTTELSPMVGKLFKNINNVYDYEKNDFATDWQHARLTSGKKEFSPLFDNGTSLGRELLEERIESMLMNSLQLDKYIRKGMSEIHWQGVKLSHFQLLKKLLSSPHKATVLEVAKRVSRKFDGRKIEAIVMSIDSAIPETHQEYRMPASRKELIVKMLSSRHQKFQDLCNAGI